LGFAVREAESGEAAIRLWQEWEPQLILMDIHMPGMDGLEAARRIRVCVNGKQPVIISVSASTLDEDRRRAMESGDMNDFLSKPFLESELLEKIKAHLYLNYIYADEEALRGVGPVVAPPSASSAELLAALPRELLDQLRDGVLTGDKSALDQLIQRVGEHDAQVAGVLQKLADNYEYETLIRLLRKIPGETEDAGRLVP